MDDVIAALAEMQGPHNNLVSIKSDAMCVEYDELTEQAERTDHEFCFDSQSSEHVMNVHLFTFDSVGFIAGLTEAGKAEQEAEIKRNLLNAQRERERILRGRFGF